MEFEELSCLRSANNVDLICACRLRMYVCIYEGRTESHEQLFFHANWEQQTKESAVVDETSCCVILECLVTSIACIT